jgi:hypothetical protein
MRNALKTIGLAFFAMFIWAGAAQAVYCPVTPGSIFSGAKNEPTPLYHGAGGGAAMDAQCTQAVAEIRRQGGQLITQEQLKGLRDTCGPSCTIWTGWRTLPSASSPQRRVRQIPAAQATPIYVPVERQEVATPSVAQRREWDRKVKERAAANRPSPQRQEVVQQPVQQATHRSRTRNVNQRSVQQEEGYLCPTCRDQNGQKYIFLRNGTAVPVDERARAVPVRSRSY